MDLAPLFTGCAIVKATLEKTEMAELLMPGMMFAVLITGNVSSRTPHAAAPRAVWRIPLNEKRPFPS